MASKAVASPSQRRHDKTSPDDPHHRAPGVGLGLYRSNNCSIACVIGTPFNLGRTSSERGRGSFPFVHGWDMASNLQ